LTGLAPGAPAVALKVLTRPIAVDPGTATVPVRLGFATPASLPIGAPTQVAIDAERHTGVVVLPLAAVVREGGDTAVFVVSDGKARRQPVMLGLSDATQVEIVSGVSPGDEVIVDGQAGLPDGAPVAVK
jgi:hypothetical protein